MTDSAFQKILHNDIIIQIGDNLDDCDLIAFCIACVQSQSSFRRKLESMRTLASPMFALHIDTTRRLLVLLDTSLRTKLSIIHKIPRILRIHESDLLRVSRPLDLVTGNVGVTLHEARALDYSKFAALCPNISIFDIHTEGFNRNSCSELTDCFRYGDCSRPEKCHNSLMTNILNSLPELPRLHLLQVNTSTSIAIQHSISRIIGPAKLTGFACICNDTQQFGQELLEAIRRGNSLRSLTVFGYYRSALALQVMSLLHNLPTVTCLETDDTSLRVLPSCHPMEYLTPLILPNLTGLKFNAFFFRHLLEQQAFERQDGFDSEDGSFPRHIHRYSPDERSRYRRLYLSLDHNRSLANFFRTHHQITHIELTNCGFLSDSFLTDLWGCLPELAALKISHSPKLTGDGLAQHSGSGWTKLKQLYLSSCRNLSTKCIVTIASTTTAKHVGIVLDDSSPKIANKLHSVLASCGYRKSLHLPCLPTMVRYYRGCESEICDADDPKIYPNTIWMA